MRSSLEREITARTSSLAMAIVTSSSSSSSSSPSLSPKKMKKKCTDVRHRRVLNVPTKMTSPSSEMKSSSSNFIVVESPAKSEVISDCRSPCCSSNNEINCNGVLADPEVESAQRSSIHLQCPSEERRKIKLDSNSTVKINEQKSTVQIKMPSNDEIEQFFAVAEKNLHKRFADKYNFDVVKDVPLEGRYEWVPIKP